MGSRQEGLSVLCASIGGLDEAPETVIGEPESEADHVLGRCAKRIRNVVESFGGTAAQRSDGKVIGYFSENEDALQSAIEIQRRVQSLPPVSGVPLTVGVGVCGGHEDGERAFFPQEGSNPAADLCNLAEPRQVLFSMPRRAGALPWMSFVAQALPALTLNSGKRRLGVFRVDWQKYDLFALRLMISRSAREGLLYLRFNDADMVLDPYHPVLSIGRNPDCDFRLLDPHASRTHARIEWRAGGFVLIDTSSNGTLVSLEGEGEIFLRRREIRLHGRGLIRFGGRSAKEGLDAAFFECALNDPPSSEGKS